MPIRSEKPEVMCDEFQAQLNALREFYNNGLHAFSGTAHEERDVSALSEAVFFQSLVALEEFISFYFVGSVTHEPTQFLASRERLIRQYLEKRYVRDSPHVTYTPPSSLSFEDARMLLDSDGKNLTFRDCEQMLQRAKEYLSPEHSVRFKRIPSDRLAVIDVARSIRNCIAHKSRRSLHEMQVRLGSLPEDGVIAVFGAGVSSVEHVGAYLKAAPLGRSRVDLFFDEFQALVRALA
jgi:hypothetical protein